MAIRDDFTAGEVLAAADLNDTFASKVPYAYGTATPSTTVDGFVWYDENETPPAPKFWDGAAFQALGGGKVLQVVRATDTTERTTTAGGFIDASISVTITPQKSTSAIILTWSVLTNAANELVRLQITDNSNNAISGAEGIYAGSSGITGSSWLINYLTARATPATTSAVTYKGRFGSNGGVSVALKNAATTGQLYAIEVSA